jgi:E3 ubiquitin-protein ligase RNF14
MEDSDEPRDVELSSLSAIFPEIQRVNDDDPYSIVLDVPVNPSKTVVVFFPTSTDGSAIPLDPHNGLAPETANGAPTNGEANVDSHELAHLPPIRLQITLGPGYPASEPPHISISTSPPWLPADVLKKLEDDGPLLWEAMGRDIVTFSYIDSVQQSAEDAFGLIDEEGGLVVDPQHKIAILDHDIKAKQAAFEKETFDCGVCLDPKKGSVCHRMLDCGHVFCITCLRDFYNNAIQEGDLPSVRCLAPNCAKEREKAALGLSATARKRKKVKTFISPSELLQIPLDQDVVKRYVTLKYKTELESDKNTIYCPRSWCNGAARSKRHRKPSGLELAEASDESGSEDEEENGTGEMKSKPYKPMQELLAVCEDCGFAFCSRCNMSWHGEFVSCTPQRDTQELTVEEKASAEYVKLHTTPCPTCAAPAQKTHGCNHMICYRCQSHFCYLCSAWLDPGNPYQHYNTMPDGKQTSCYMRLWELEDGDGDDVGHNFAGGAAQGAVGAPPAARELIPEIEEAEDDEATQAARRLAQEELQRRNAQENGGQVAFAREGPLVLRIAGNQPAGAVRGGARRGRNVDPAAAAAVPPARGGPQGNGNVARGQAARGGRGGGVGRGGRGGAGPFALRGGGGGNNNNNARNPRQNDQTNNQQARIVQRHNDAAAAHGRQPPGGEGANPEGGDLDEEQAAWIRNFVQLALNDEEDSDSDEDDI